MKNYLILTLSIFLTFQISQAQIKIGGNQNSPINPAHALDIEGNITVRNRIYAGGDDNTLGNPGKSGQVLVSQGANNPPRWRTLNLPTIENNFYYLIYNNAFTDFGGSTTPGQVYASSNVGTSGNGPYTLNTARNNSMFSNFVTISGLTKPFQVHSDSNQVYITFEAVAHINSDTQNQGVDFSCGIFVGGSQQSSRTLKGIRRVTLQQPTSASLPFMTFTQIALASGLTKNTTSNPDYYVEVACKRNLNLGSFSGDLGIGRTTNTANMNDFMTKTSLKVEVYEEPQVFKDPF